MRLFRLVLACCSLASAAIPTQSTELQIGQPAPLLTFTHLEHAPSGAKTDWTSLRGKVVVLEFWATWCTACIQQIPHLNSLVRSVGSENIVFIAVDDEDPAVTRKLLAKFPIEGWLGFDVTKKTIEAYGAQTRPKTVVIDPAGRIAAILQPEQLTGAPLAALAAGQKVTFPADTLSASIKQAHQEEAAIDKLADGAAGTKSLFNISVFPGDPNGHASILAPSDDPTEPFKIDAINAPVMLLISFMGMPLDRVRLRYFGPETYTLHVSAPSGDETQFGAAIQLAVATAAGLRITRTNDEEDVWLMQALSDANKRLQPAAPGKGHLAFVERNTHKLILERASLDKLAETLELSMRVPVLNESGIAGTFDAAFDLSNTRPEAVKAALEQAMGLTLVRARRKIERITLDRAFAAPEAKSASPGP